jgi:hypothetical protein
VQAFYISVEIKFTSRLQQQQQQTRKEMLENLETIHIVASSVVIPCDLASRDHVSDEDAASIFKDEM